MVPFTEAEQLIIAHTGSEAPRKLSKGNAASGTESWGLENSFAEKPVSAQQKQATNSPLTKTELTADWGGRTRK